MITIVLDSITCAKCDEGPIPDKDWPQHLFDCQGVDIRGGPRMFVDGEEIGRDATTPLAAQLFDLDIKLANLEDDVFAAILKIIEVDRDAGWPFEDWSRDYYDSSFELLKADRRILLSDEQRGALRALGFMRCWIRYKEDAANVPIDLKRNVVSGEREDSDSFYTVAEVAAWNQRA